MIASLIHLARCKTTRNIFVIVKHLRTRKRSTLQLAGPKTSAPSSSGQMTSEALAPDCDPQLKNIQGPGGVFWQCIFVNIHIYIYMYTFIFAAIFALYVCF